MRRVNRTSIFRVRAALLGEGMTLQEWADRNGFKYCTVMKVMRRHLGQERSRPRGEKTLRILAALERYASHKPSSASKGGGSESGGVGAGCEVVEEGKVAYSANN